MTFNKKHSLIFLAILVILLTGMTIVSATEANDANNTQKIRDNKILSTPAKYDVDKMVQSEASQASKDADEYNKNTSKQESKQITKKTYTTTKQAQEITVTDYANLKTTLETSTDEELTVTLDGETYTSNGPITVNTDIKTLTINGNGKTVNGDSKVFLNLNNINLTLKDITVTGCIGGMGGAITATNTNLTIMDSTFTDNHATDGAVLYADGGETTILRSTFRQNSLTSTSDKYGVIKVFNNGILTLDDNTFDSNSIFGTEGFIVYTTPTSKIVNNIFQNNNCHDTANYFSGLINVLVNEIHDNEYYGNELDVKINNSFLDHNHQVVIGENGDFTRDMQIYLSKNLYNSTVKNGTLEVSIGTWDANQKSFTVENGIAHVHITDDELIQYHNPQESDGRNTIYFHYSPLDNSYNGNAITVIALSEDESEDDLELLIDEYNSTINLGQNVTVKGHFYRKYYPDPSDYEHYEWVGVPEATVHLIVDDDIVLTTTTDSEGKLEFEYHPTAKGTYFINLRAPKQGAYPRKNAYLSSEEPSFKVLGYATNITFSATSVTVGEEVTVSGYIYDVSTGNPISLSVASGNKRLTLDLGDGTSQRLTYTNGQFSTTFTPTAAGTFTATITFPANGDYVKSVNTTKYTVSGAKTNMTINNNESILVGQNVDIRGVLSTEGGSPVKNTKVNITVGTTPYPDVTVNASGQYALSCTLDKVGTYPITVVYVNHTTGYTSSTNTSSVIVNPRNTNMTIENNETILVGQTVTINGTLTDELNDSVKDTYVNISIGEKLIENVEVNSEGFYTTEYQIDTVGTYDIIVVYTNDTTRYNSSTNKSSVTVNPRNTNMTIQNNESIIVGQEVTITGILTDELGKIIPNTYVNITIGTIEINNVIVNETGEFENKTIIDEVGNFTIKVVYNNHTTNYTSSTNTSNVTVNPRNTNMTVNNNETIYVGQFVTINGTLTDELNDTVKDTYVNITVGDALIKNVRVDSEGFYTTEYQINVTDTLPITVVYTNDTTRYISSTNISSVNVIPRNTNMTITNNASVLVGQEVNITGVLYDNLDEVIPNTVLTIRIGKYYINDELTVDENGRYELIYPASEVGEHNITITYTSDNTNYTSSINMSSFLVKPRATNMTIEHNGPIRVGENLTVSGYLIDELGDLVVNTHVNITVGNQKAENVIVDGNGYYEHDFTLTHNDTYIITVEYLNDSMYYISSTNKTEYKLEKVATSTNVTVVNDKLYNVTIDVVVYENTTEFDKIIESGILNVTVNGNSKLYTVTGSTTRIVLDGNVNITTTDELELTVEYLSNDYYLNSTNLTLLHASPLNSSLTVDFWGFPYQVLDTVNITGQVFDEYGNVITSGTVDIVINDDISNSITGVPIKFDENRGAYVYNYEHITPVGDINNVTVYYTGQKTSQGNYLILPSVNNNSYNASKIYVSIDIIVLNNTYGNSSVYINCTNGTYPNYGLTPNGTVVVSDYDDDIFGYRFEIDLAQQDTPGEFNITLPLYKENNRVKIEYFGNDIFDDNVYAQNVPKEGPIENWKDINLEPHETLTTISLVDPTSGEVVETVMSGGVLNITGHVSSIEGESSIEDEIRENGHVDIKVYKYNETTGEYEYSSIIEGISIDPLTGNYVYSMNIEELPNHIDSQKLQFIAFYENMNSLIAPSESNVVNLIIAKNPTITNVEKILSNKSGEVALRINVTNITGKLVETGHVIVFNATSGAVLGEGNLENGRVDISLDDVTIPGDILVNVTYQGNPYYSSSKASGNTPGLENTTTITVTVDPSITISLDKAVTIIGESVRVSGIAYNETNQPVTSGSVNVTIGGKDYIATLDTTTGEYYFDYIPTANGTFTINATYIDDDVQVVTSEDVLLLVNKINSTTKVAIINSTAGNVTLNVSVEGADGNKTMTGTVSIIIDGNTVVPLELTGKESYIVNLENNLAHSGLVSVQVIFNENMQYYSSKAETDEINVLNQTPILKVEMLEANVVNSTTATITGTLTDDLGHNISDAYIEVMVDGENVGVVRTNSTGGFTFEYTANKLGENIVNVTYLGDNIRYSNATNNTKFTVYKLNTTVELNVTDINYTNTEIINFTINETEATGLVTVEVTSDVEGFTPITEDYEFNGEVLQLPVSGLKAGTYTVTVSYPGDGKYNANSTIRTFKVESQPDYNINVSAVNITYGEEETITVSLPEDAKETVNVKITGINNNFVTDKTIDLSSGNTLVIPAYELVVGEYEVNISYIDDNYALKTNTTKFTVSKAESHIAVSVDDVVGTETAVAELTIRDTNANGKANITIYDSKNAQVGEVIQVDTVTSAQPRTVLVNLVPGIYTVNVTYYDDNNYNNSNASYTFTVNRIPTVTNVTIVNNTAGNVTLNITVKGADNKIIKEGKVNITVAGNIVDVDLSGDDYTVVNLADNITTSGEVSVTVLYTGNDTYLESFANNTADNKQLEYINVDKQVPIITVNVDKANVVNTTSVLISGTLIDDLGNNIADRYVDIYVQGELVGSVKTDSNGKYTYTLVADTLGEIVVNATFPGDSGEAPRYSNATNNTKFTVYKLDTTVELNVTDINYTNTEIINFTINETEATGLVTVEVTGDVEGFTPITEDYEFNGEVLQLPVSGLKAGTYTVTLSYPGDGKYNGNSTEKTFTVNKNSDYKLNVTAYNITYGEIDYIIVNLPEDAKGIVTINVTGFDPIELNLTKYNSIGFEAYELAAGEYTVNISYTDDNYALKTNTTTFTVGKAASNVGVSAVNITRGYNETITVTLPEYEHAKGNVSVIISKTDSIVREYVIEASQFASTGFNMSIIENLDADTYHVNVFFTNDTNYNDSTYSQVFDVVLPEISLYDSSEILVGESVLIHGTVTDPNNNEITGSIRLKIKDESNNITYNEYEKGIDKVFIKEGIYTVTASYVYNGEIIVTSEPITIKVNKIPTKTTITIENSQVDNVSISVKVTDNQESPVTSGTLKVTLPTGNMSVPVKGTNTIIPVDTTKAGKIEVTVEYLENNEYKQSNATETITVTKLDTTIIVDATTPVKAGKTSIISGVLTDENNKALNAAKVQIKVDNRVVANVTTDKDGKYTYTVKDAIVGTHNVEAIYNGNNKYNGASDKTSFTVEKLGTKIIQDKIKDVPYGENITITGKLVDENNKAISGQPVKVRFDGKTKTVTTDNDGKYRAIFPTNSVGQKEASTEYAGNNKYDPTQVTDNAKVNKNKAKISLTMPKDAKVGQPTSILGKVTDKDGKVVAGMPVNVKVNGKTIKTVTDDKGNFNVEVTPVEGNNPVTVTSGNDNYDVDDVTSKFTATRKDATLSLDPLKNTKLKDNVTVTGKLVDEKGNPISYAPVKVTVNGKTTTVTTDKNGKYELPVTNVVEGKNNVSVKYEDAQYKTQTKKATFTASKSKTIVKVPSVVGVIGEKITLTAYVTDDDGKPVNGGNLVFKLNGRTLRTDGRFDTNNTSPLKLSVKDGKVTYTMTADLYLRNGKNITASYSGSSKYEAAKANIAEANIKKRNAKVVVSVTPNNTKQDTDIVFTATLRDVTPNGTNKTSLTTDANIIFKVNGVTIKDKNGKANHIPVRHSVINYAYHVPTGMGGVDADGNKNYIVEAVYDNPVFYPDTRNNATFNVQRSKVNINFIETKVHNNVLSVKANFTDFEDKYLVGTSNVCVKINGKTYEENGETKYFTVKDGKVKLTDIKIASGIKVKSVMLVTGAREAYLGARATTTDIITA